MKKTNIILIALFSVYISTFFVLNILSADKDFSQIENRTLQTLPNFSSESLFSGEYTKKINTYVTDQFIFRDNFVQTKSKFERILGKDYNNGVYITNENTLIDKFNTPNYENIDKNINSIVNFAKKVDVPVYTSIFPTQNDIYSYKLDKNTPVNSQKDVIEHIKSKTDNFIDVYNTLEKHNKEYIFYNTDHHWTSLGAYYAYTDIITSLGKTKTELGTKNIVSLDFYGTISSKSGIRYIKPDTIDVYTENFDIEIEDGNGIRQGKMYDYSKLDVYDKYGMFLGGNHPIVRFNGTGEGEILLIKDSYSNALVPFLYENYAKVHMIDLRFNKSPVSDYIKNYNIDEILVAYSASNFESDKNLTFLK